MRQKRFPGIVSLAALVGVIFWAGQAQAQLSEADRTILEDFFLAANGENWRRNDGWLETGSDPCDWYGVECQFRSGIERDIVRSLDLSGNHLTGTLDTRIFEVVHWALDLSDNAISGTLDALPASPGFVDLSRNAFEGTLPNTFSERTDDISGAPRPTSNWHLDLSGNNFEGEIPPDWHGPVWLSLADNRLEGMPLSLLDGSRHPLDPGFLDLSDNRFSGDVPVSIMNSSFLPHNGHGRWGGGLNLCWNDWSLPESAEFHEWLTEHHIGGEIERCLTEGRESLDPSISGSWYDPERSGEGIALQALDNGMILSYLFTFDEAGNQQWLVGAETANDTSVSWRELLRTRGRFGSGLLDGEEDPIKPRGSLRIDRLGSDHLVAERVYIHDTSGVCLAVYPPPLNCFGNSLSDRRNYQQLSRLAGTSCDNQSDLQQYSGTWYSPERSGEGFLVEMLPDDRVVVYWFTYQPEESGNQAWMIGNSAFRDDGIIIDPPPPWEEQVKLTLYQPTGTSFGPDFDADDVNLQEWGELEMRFNGDGTGQVVWNSNSEDYGSGKYFIERLTQPKLADCD